MDEHELGRQLGQSARRSMDVAALTFVTLAETGTFDITTLGENAALFDRWQPGVTYKAGQIRIDPTNGVLYRCLAAHGLEHSIAPPSQSPTLWGRIADPADEWPEWFPYSGVNDAWMMGSKCRHSGKRWVSKVDYNVWEPGNDGGAAWEGVS